MLLPYLVSDLSDGIQSVISQIDQNILRTDNMLKAFSSTYTPNIHLFTDQEICGLLSNMLFDFTSPEGRVAVSTHHGILSIPKQVKPEQRKWVKEAPEKPRQLIFCPPDSGITIEEYIVPIGYGLTDSGGKFLGTISTGININNLCNLLNRTIHHDYYSFLLFMEVDDQYHFVLSSEKSEQRAMDDKILTKLNQMNFKEGNDDFLEKDLIIQGRTYSFYSRLKNSPFLLLVGLKISLRLANSPTDFKKTLKKHFFS